MKLEHTTSHGTQAVACCMAQAEDFIMARVKQTAEEEGAQVGGDGAGTSSGGAVAQVRLAHDICCPIMLAHAVSSH